MNSKYSALLLAILHHSLIVPKLTKKITMCSIMCTYDIITQTHAK